MTEEIYKRRDTENLLKDVSEFQGSPWEEERLSKGDPEVSV